MSDLKLSTTQISTIKSEVGKKFIYAENMVQVICTAFNIQQNVLFYGPGGYGKTEIVDEVFSQIEAILKVKAKREDCHVEMSVEDLIGGLDLQEMLGENKRLKANFEKSVFFKSDLVVLDEFLDLPSAALESLKAILSGRKFSYQQEVEEAPFKIVVGCTNKSIADLREMDGNHAASMDALASRFLFIEKVVWSRHASQDYSQLAAVKGYNKASHDFIEPVCEALEAASSAGAAISPRIATGLFKLLAEVPTWTRFEIINGFTNLSSSAHSAFVSTYTAKYASKLNAKMYQKAIEDALIALEIFVDDDYLTAIQADTALSTDFPRLVSALTSGRGFLGNLGKTVVPASSSKWVTTDILLTSEEEKLVAEKEIARTMGDTALYNKIAKTLATGKRIAWAQEALETLSNQTHSKPGAPNSVIALVTFISKKNTSIENRIIQILQALNG